MANLFPPNTPLFSNLILEAYTSGYVLLTVPPTVTPYNLIFPAAQAVGVSVLENDGLGNLSWVPGSSVGVNVVGPFSASSQVNGATISGNTITFGPADATNPGMIKASGNQTIGASLRITNPLRVGNLTIDPSGSPGLSTFASTTSTTAVATIGTNSSGGNLPLLGALTSVGGSAGNPSFIGMDIDGSNNINFINFETSPSFFQTIVQFRRSDGAVVFGGPGNLIFSGGNIGDSGLTGAPDKIYAKTLVMTGPGAGGQSAAMLTTASTGSLQLNNGSNNFQFRIGGGNTVIFFTDRGGNNNLMQFSNARSIGTVDLFPSDGGAASSLGLDGSEWHDVFITNRFKANVAGAGLDVKVGANARMGTSTLVGGTVVVSNTSVTAATKIFLTTATAGGTLGVLSYTSTAGVGFTITSTSALDTSTVNWMLNEAL